MEGWVWYPTRQEKKVVELNSFILLDWRLLAAVGFSNPPIYHPACRDHLNMLYCPRRRALSSTTPPDIEGFKKMDSPYYQTWNLDHLSPEDQTTKFHVEFFPLIMRFADGQPLNDMLVAHEWCSKLLRDTDYEPALRACSEEPNKMTLQLRELVNLMYGAYLAIEFFKQMEVSLLEEFRYASQPS
jgi:hypothetical protein